MTKLSFKIVQGVMKITLFVLVITDLVGVGRNDILLKRLIL
jgi:hypothetical protein